MTTLLTIEAIATELQVSPGVIKGLVKRGHIRARRDGRISERAYVAFIHRQQRLTRRYIDLYRGGKGLPARAAWQQAVSEDDQRRGLAAARKVSAILTRRDVQVTTCTQRSAGRVSSMKTSGQPARSAHVATATWRNAYTSRTIGGRR